MAPLQSTESANSLQRLEQVELRLADAVEVAGRAVEELGGAAQAEAVVRHCQAFMEAVNDVQAALKSEIANLWDYIPYENCDYVQRMGAEIALEKLQWVEGQVHSALQAAEEGSSVAASGTALGAQETDRVEGDADGGTAGGGGEKGNSK